MYVCLAAREFKGKTGVRPRQNTPGDSMFGKDKTITEVLYPILRALVVYILMGKRRQ